VVLVTHDAKVAAYADREATMRDGALETPYPFGNLVRDDALAMAAGS
jgi:ABC-type lipoprotein export system ATPase subunit